MDDSLLEDIIGSAPDELAERIATAFIESLHSGRVYHFEMSYSGRVRDVMATDLPRMSESDIGFLGLLGFDDLASTIAGSSLESHYAILDSLGLISDPLEVSGIGSREGVTDAPRDKISLLASIVGANTEAYVSGQGDGLEIRGTIPVERFLTANYGNRVSLIRQMGEDETREHAGMLFWHLMQAGQFDYAIDAATRFQEYGLLMAGARVLLEGDEGGSADSRRLGYAIKALGSIEGELKDAARQSLLGIASRDSDRRSSIYSLLALGEDRGDKGFCVFDADKVVRDEAVRRHLVRKGDIAVMEGEILLGMVAYAGAQDHGKLSSLGQVYLDEANTILQEGRHLDERGPETVMAATGFSIDDSMAPMMVPKPVTQDLATKTMYAFSAFNIAGDKEKAREAALAYFELFRNDFDSHSYMNTVIDMYRDLGLDMGELRAYFSWMADQAGDPYTERTWRGVENYIDVSTRNEAGHHDSIYPISVESALDDILRIAGKESTQTGDDEGATDIFTMISGAIADRDYDSLIAIGDSLKQLPDQGSYIDNAQSRQLLLVSYLGAAYVNHINSQ